MNFYDDAVRVFEHTARENAREAYKKGYADGQADTPFTDTQRAEELAYERGLNDAWECARKICTNWCMSDESLSAIFGNGKTIDDIMKEHSASEAIEKMKEWKEKQEKDYSKCVHAMPCGKSTIVCDKNQLVCNKCDRYEPKQDDTEIRVGDEVKDNYALKGMVLKIYNNVAKVIRSSGVLYDYDLHDLRKTGKHYDIESILKQMQEG